MKEPCLLTGLMYSLISERILLALLKMVVGQRSSRMNLKLERERRVKEMEIQALMMSLKMKALEHQNQISQLMRSLMYLNPMTNLPILKQVFLGRSSIEELWSMIRKISLSSKKMKSTNQRKSEDNKL